MPTTNQDPERARLQRAAIRDERRADFADDESDWAGLLLGIALALSTISLTILAIRLTLGVPQ